MTVKIIPIPAFDDNYIWLLHNGKQAWVVDPGDATPVQRHLDRHGLTLCGILITHHHWDHVNGLEQLQKQYACPTYAPSDDRIPGQLIRVKEGDVVNIPTLDLQFKVLETPGHTLSHVCYHNDAWLFCGDTLFSMGCGRMFEGTAEMYVSSLHKLKQLAPETLVYCTHEYTTTNVTFAQTVDPHNLQLKKYANQVLASRQQNLPTLPTVLCRETQLNPFLRTHEPTIQDAVERHFQQTAADEVSCFAGLRQWKDQF